MTFGLSEEDLLTGHLGNLERRRSVANGYAPELDTDNQLPCISLIRCCAVFGINHTMIKLLSVSILFLVCWMVVMPAFSTKAVAPGLVGQIYFS